MTFAEVMLWGTKIGTVALPDDSNIATFRYDRDFLDCLMRPFTDCRVFLLIHCRTGSEIRS